MKKNIVILSYSNGHPTGVVRYIKMLVKGLAMISDVNVHFIVLDTTILLTEINKENGIVTAKIPFPSDSRSLQKEQYWRAKYFNVITEILLPCFEGISHLIWHVNELVLCKLADLLKSALGGRILVHLHITIAINGSANDMANTFSNSVKYEKKLISFFLLLPLMCFAVFTAYLLVSSVIDSNKTYYFLQIETYLKVYKPPFNEYGYVLFSRDSMCSFSKNIDFVKIWKSEISEVTFVFNPSEQNKIYIVDRSNNAQINQVNFSMEKISSTDKLFLKKILL